VHRTLRALVGDEHLITDPARLLVYDSDGLTAYRRPPRAVVLPGATEELVGVVRALHEAGIPVVPRGAGTGLSGGALPDSDAVVVGTARMDRILDVDPENRLARVQPGVVNSVLGRALAPHGLCYAPDPSSQSACTLGGNVAENSGGPHCLKYGVTSRYVSGLTLVLAGGALVEVGGAASDPAAGLDLVGAFVGSEGCFGIAAEIELRLMPLPGGARTLLGIFDGVEDAARAVTAIVAEGLLPAALEIMDGASIQAVEASVYAAGYPTDAGAALVVEFDGTEAGLDEDADRAEACCREAGARAVERADDEAQRARLWQGRKKAFGAMGRIAPDLLVQDATVPRTRLPQVLREIMEIGDRYGLRVGNVFHAGDGNLHPKILFDRRDPDELERVERASREMMEVCVAAGGTITGEHGVGLDKLKYMTLVHGPDELQAMRDVRDAFDPSGLFNPGKVVPEPDAAPPERSASEGGAGRTGAREAAPPSGAEAGAEPAGAGSGTGARASSGTPGGGS
jgi:glycolate oxidase subunit GlcD